MTKKLKMIGTAEYRLKEALKNCKLGYENNARTREFSNYILNTDYIAIPIIAAKSSENTIEKIEILKYLRGEDIHLRKTFLLFYERAKEISNIIYYTKFIDIEPNPLNEKFAVMFGYAFLSSSNEKQKSVKARYHVVDLGGDEYEEVPITIQKFSEFEYSLDFDELVIKGLKELENTALSQGCTDIGSIKIKPTISHTNFDEASIRTNLEINGTVFKNKY